MSPLLILPVAFLILSFLVMLSTWWVSFILKTTTGQLYALHFPLDPLSIFYPSNRMYRHAPDKPFHRILHPISPSPTPATPPPTLEPKLNSIPASPASPPTNVPTFTKQSDHHILEALIDTLGPSYLASSFPPSAFHDHLSFYATSELDDYVIIDTGATSSSSYNIDDFEADTYRKLNDATVHGISGMPVAIAGIGFVIWTVHDSKGDQITLCAPATHIPPSDVCLFSPQRFFQTCDKCADDAHLSTYRNNSLLWLDDDIQILSQHPKGLPIIELLPHKSPSEIMMLSKTKTHPIPPLTLPSNQNLTPPEKLLLLWHYRLGHAGFNWIKHLGRHHYLGTTGLTINGVKDHPKCTACLYARQHYCPTGDSHE